jgi:pimeloyl-ACP methyl ester carboxylesterase
MHEDLLSLKLQLLQTGFPERLVKLPQNAQVAWREAGDASSDFAVVLLHGISSGAASWLDVALQLADKVRVLPGMHPVMACRRRWPNRRLPMPTMRRRWPSRCWCWACGAAFWSGTRSP